VRGRQILIEPLKSGGLAALLVVDGRLQDLLIDPPDAEAAPRPEAIYLARSARPMKGLGGMMVDLGQDQRGYLRGARGGASGIASGSLLLVQVSGWAEPGKAPPVSDRPLLKGRTAILTPGAPGANVARSIRDTERRDSLAAVGKAGLEGADPNLGLILRSAAADAADAEVLGEIAALRAMWQDVRDRTTSGEVGRVRAAPDAGDQGWRDWFETGTQMIEGKAAIADAGLWEDVTALLKPRVGLVDGAFIMIEPTSALVAVDVNTGAALSPAAALKANLAASAELPRQLRLRGLGGQIMVDFAPLPKAERRRIEGALGAALRQDGIDTTISGWTPLGHLEMQRKRARRPLVELAGQIPE
jgi:ribonuclease G